jgi:hypothetical protein
MLAGFQDPSIDLCLEDGHDESIGGHMTKKNDRKKIGKKGGNARAEALTSEQRKEIARHAAQARWGNEPSVLLKATHAGDMDLGGVTVPSHVLEDGTRVLSLGGFENALGSRRGKRGSMDDENGTALVPVFLASEGIKQWISDDLTARLQRPMVFTPKRGGRTAFGYEATILPEVCKAILRARREKTLKANQEHLAVAAEIIVSALANVGIVALVDEATGYQHDRARDELQKLLSQYIAAELLEWTRRFPNDFFKQIYKIHGWKYQPGVTQGPRYVGKFIKKYVYGKLPPGVVGELEKKNPVVDGRRRFKHFQWLTEHTGHPHLDAQIVKVTTILQLSDNKGEFERNFAKAFPETGQQTEMELRKSEEPDEE